MSLGLEKLLLTNQAQKEKDTNWFFSRERIENGTPSRLRGMSYEDEIKLRRSTVRFLHKLSEVSYSHRNLQANSASAAAANARSASHNGNRFETIGLGIGNFNRIIFATASVWFHRFFMVHPLQVFDSYEIAATCFYLATKVEDQSLSLGYIVACSQKIMEWSGVPICHTAEQMEEELKDLESCLMMTLGFIVWVRHPYPYIGQLVEQLIGEKEQVERIAKVATQYVTDSLGSIFCVRIDPRKLAIASITWACQELSFPLNNWKNKSGAGTGEKSVLLTHWVESFNLKLEDVRKLFGEYAEHVRRDTVEREDDGENGALLQHGEERLILKPLVDPRRRPPQKRTPQKQQVHQEVLEPTEPEPVVAVPVEEDLNSMPTLSPPPSSSPLRQQPSPSTPPIPILHPHHEQEQLIIPQLIIIDSADPNSNGSFTSSSNSNSNSSSSLDNNNHFENMNINIQFPIDFDLDLNLDLDLDFNMRKRKKMKMDHSVNLVPRDTNTK